MPAALFLCLLAGLLLRFESPLLRDLDVGWLVRAGELIWQTGSLPQEDVFSFTQAGRPWVLYQWGSELYFGGLHRWAALGGVVWGTVLFIALTYSLLLYFLLRQGVNRLLSLGLVLLALLVGVFYWLSRPVTLTFFLYTVTLLVLEDYRRAPRWQLWLLPPLFALWANLHLGFVVALGAVGLYGAAAWLVPRAFRGPGSSRDLRPLLALPLCLAAISINPYGPLLLGNIWKHATLGYVLQGQVVECQSPDFHNPAFIPFFAQLVLLFWVRGRDYPGRPLLLTLAAITLGLGLYSLRHIPYFGITATLHLAQALMGPGDQEGAPAPLTHNQRGWGWAVLGAILSLGWVVGLEYKHPGFYQFEARYVPRGAADYLARQPGGLRPLRLFSTVDQWGSYFIYRLYPQVQVFIDTRFDFYGDAFASRFLSLRQEVLSNPEVLSPWEVDFLVLEKKGLPKPLPPHPRWALVYEDEQALIYRHLREDRDQAPAPGHPQK